MSVKSSISNSIESKISIYPNPASSLLTIESPIDNLVIEIFDLKGIKIISKRIASGRHLDIANIDNGVYVIMVLNQKNEVLHTERLVISK